MGVINGGEREMLYYRYNYDFFFKKLKDSGITMNELCEKYGVSSTTLKRMHTKHSAIHFSTAYDLMRIVGIESLDKFVHIELVDDTKETTEPIR